ncbi:MAG: division/cell wall cluster transcriptional repressor MraZ [Gammaproteobacteria bacterium]|nr:division/cell wall cluster transcriptional repressor MraZ [Gammaproteobacteria bacterium]
MFRGFCSVSIDPKGRLGLPTRYRALLAEQAATLVITVNPWDRALWLYSLAAWTTIDEKLLALPDGDLASRRAKQVIRGYATDCECDTQGRILVPQEHRSFAGLSRRASLLGQGNKLELWDAAAWERQRDAWLVDVDQGAASSSSILGSLSL